MQNLFSLNDLYTRYAAGLLKKAALETAIFKAVQKSLQRFGMVGWTRNECDDFVSSLYPRISRAIDMYQETGSNFDNYIGSVVSLAAKEFRSHQVHSYVEEAAAWITQIPEMYACENESVYNDEAEETGQQGQLKNPRQLLILILKCCNHVSPEFLERAAPRLDIDSNVINRLIDHLKEYRKKNEMENAILRERVNRQFFRCILFEKKIQLLSDDSPLVPRLKKQLEQEQNRLKKTRNRLIKMRIEPSNRQIAQLLGISKGTVDSALHTLKARNPLPPSKQAKPDP
jgi:hypothetical protein